MRKIARIGGVVLNVLLLECGVDVVVSKRDRLHSTVIVMLSPQLRTQVTLTLPCLGKDGRNW